ncbi:MAG: carbamoyl-phosphate synthase large subunit, partial [Pseudomonadota bacterium]
QLYTMTYIKPYFIQQMKELVLLEEEILKCKGGKLPDELLAKAKRDGFADRYLAMLLSVTETEIRKQRTALGLVEGWEAVPVSGVKDASYYFSTYNAPDKTKASSKPKVMILGGGPNRIGQGIEFDYCCVHAAFALKDMGYETVIVNCNPETVSTDYDTSDKLYFEPLTVEDVLSIYEKEKPLGVIVQFGGQTPLNIAGELEKEGVRILGTSQKTIDLAEDREQFNRIMRKLDIPMPASGMAVNIGDAVRIANEIGYPLMVRPSYVLGGRGMEIVHDEEMLGRYMAAAVGVTPERPILIDKFLGHAIEAEADAISDGKDAFVPTVMEHVEYAGIHSGDSACVIPPVSIPVKHINTIVEYTRKIAKEMKVIGLMNMQYAIADDKVYVLEANPRASRTVPLVSKVCNISMARIATEIIMAGLKGKKYPMISLVNKKIPHYGVKEAVLPFNMFPEVDPVLGPEMRSTGEVLGMADSFELAYYKAQEAAQTALPSSGTVFISVNDDDKPDVLEAAKEFERIGFKLLATEGTCNFLKKNGVYCELIKKVFEGNTDIVDGIESGRINIIINTPLSRLSEFDDSFIRKIAIKHKVPYITAMSAAWASAKGIAAYIENGFSTSKKKSLQEYHADIDG